MKLAGYHGQPTWKILWPTISQKSKLRTYSIFKSALYTEIYLYQGHKKIFREALTRFRCSCHKLAIETGRHNITEEAKRFCPLCKRLGLYHIETEYHFLLSCSSYSTLRSTFIDEYFYRNPTYSKFATLMSTNCKCTVIKLAKYIYHAFELRESLTNHWCI